MTINEKLNNNHSPKISLAATEIWQQLSRLSRLSSYPAGREDLKAEPFKEQSRTLILPGKRGPIFGCSCYCSDRTRKFNISCM